MVSLSFDERQRLAEKFYPQVVKLAVNMSRRAPRGVDESDLVSLVGEVTIDCRDNYYSDDPSKFQNYLFKSAKNRVIDFLRRRKARNGVTKRGRYYRTISLDDVSTSTSSFTEGTSYDPVDFRESKVGSERELREEQELLRRRVGNENFKLLYLVYFKRLSYDEISGILGVSTRVVQNRTLAAKRSVSLWISGYKDEDDFYANRSLAFFSFK